jgi:hypothetical protein
MPGVPITPGFIRPDPHPGADLPTITKSATGLLNDGQPSPYSILTDYTKGLVAQGLVRDVDDLIRNYTHLIGEIFFQWISE